MDPMGIGMYLANSLHLRTSFFFRKRFQEPPLQLAQREHVMVLDPGPLH